MRAWKKSGSAFEIDWGGRIWSLRPAGAQPGLECSDPRIGPVLALEGVAEPKRWSQNALSGATLVDVEQRSDRILATYRPLGWGALQVRAAWTAFEDCGIDLDVEVQARSIGRLRSLEVKLITTFENSPEAGRHRSVTPRDAHAASLSYDGREHDLAALTTGPPGEPLTPWLAPRAGLEGQTYVELALPNDASRRIHEGKLPFATTRYGLFGHDLEKGIVLRARLRGLWLPKSSALAVAETQWARFLQEPPPLRT